VTVVGLAFSVKLSICPGCRNFVEQLRETIAITGALDEDDITPPLDELLAQFDDWKIAADEPRRAIRPSTRQPPRTDRFRRDLGTRHLAPIDPDRQSVREIPSVVSSSVEAAGVCHGAVSSRLGALDRL
jgi:hypothetical protein